MVWQRWWAILIPHPGESAETHYWHEFGEDLTVSQFTKVLIYWRHLVYLALECFVKVSQVNTVTNTAIWFKDRDDTCTPFSCWSIASIWLFTFGISEWGIFLWLYRQKGTASGRSVMWHSVFSFPSPLKSAGNSALKSVGPVFISSTSLSARLMSPSSTQALLLSNEHFWLCTTYIGSVNFDCLYFSVT